MIGQMLGTGDQTSTAAARRLVFLAASIIGLLTVLPILMADHLPLLDAPAHEARLAILREIQLGHSSLFYTSSSFLLPNIAFDLIGLGLVHLVDPEIAGRIYFALSLLLTLWGILTLNRVATGRWSFAPLVSGLLLYNLISISGFFSYMFGLALVPWALAVRLKLQSAPRWIGLLSGSVCGIILVFCHAFAFVVYATMSVGFALADILGKRAGLTASLLRLLDLVVPASIFLLWSNGEARQIAYGAPYIADKLSGLAEALTSGSMIADIALVMGILTFIITATRSQVRLSSAFVPGLAVLFLLYLVLPFQFGVGANIDKRVPIALAFLALAGLDISARRDAPSLLLASLVICAMIAKQGALALLWQSFDPGIDAIAASVKSLPPGAVIMQAECHPNRDAMMTMYGKWQPAMTHVAALANFADSRFVASTFANPGQQPLAVKAPYQDFYRLQGTFGSFTCAAEDYRKQLADIRALAKSPEIAAPVYFLLIRPPAPKLLAGDAALVSAGQDFELYATGR